MFMLAKQTKMEHCPDRVHVQHNFLLFYGRSRSETYVKEKL
jgi:hypothetical protein